MSTVCEMCTFSYFARMLRPTVTRFWALPLRYSVLLLLSYRICYSFVFKTFASLQNRPEHHGEIRLVRHEAFDREASPASRRLLRPVHAPVKLVPRLQLRRLLPDDENPYDALRSVD